MENDRKINIAFIKTIMMISIVICHALSFYTENWFTVVSPKYNAHYLGKIAEWFGTFHVQTFTFASGYLFYYLKIERGKYKDTKKDLVKRAKRLIIPYIFTSILWVIPIAIYFFKYTMKDILVKYVLMTAPSQLWFLGMLFLVFAFFEIFSDKIKISTKSLILVYILTTGLSLTLSKIGIVYFQISKAMQYILYFYFGGYIYINSSKLNIKNVLIFAILSIFIYFGSNYIDGLNIMLLHYGIVLITPLLSLLEISIIYFVYTAMINKRLINTDNRLYSLLESNSFGIYLFHQQIIYFTIILLNGVVQPIIQVLLSFIIALTLSLLMSWMLKKNKYTRFMFGL